MRCVDEWWGFPVWGFKPGGLGLEGGYGEGRGGKVPFFLWDWGWVVVVVVVVGFFEGGGSIGEDAAAAVVAAMSVWDFGIGV